MSAGFRFLRELHCMSTDTWTIREDDLSGSDTRALLRLHLEGMHAQSPPGSVFALDLTGLAAPNVTVWTVWCRERNCRHWCAQGSWRPHG